MIDIPTLDTARLRLRPYRIDDFERYASMWAEPAVVRFIGGAPLSREAAWIRFLRQIGLWHYLGFGFFAIEDRATGAFLGEGGFHDLRRTLQPSIEGTMEVGWGLVTEAQGRGLAEEAMRAALGWADGRFPRCPHDLHHPPGPRAVAARRREARVPAVRRGRISWVTDADPGARSSRACQDLSLSRPCERAKSPGGHDSSLRGASPLSLLS